MEIKIVKQHRRTVSISVTENLTVLVKAPYGVSQKFIDDFIKEKQRWIAKRIAETAELAPPRRRQFQNGETFLYLGKEYPLFVTSDKLKGLHFDGVQFTVSQNSLKKAKQLFTAWYKHQTEKILNERLPYFTGIVNNANGFFSFFLDINYKSFKVVNTHNQLGACTSKGDLRFSLRLAMMPLEVIDYVIVHELVHLKEFNHSPKFWKEVERILPDYKTPKEYLRKNHALIIF
jgi:predicted metal-dependent hydrolase